ncbi:MAG: polyprenyl synthetase family protein [Bacillota bacterium]
MRGGEFSAFHARAVAAVQAGVARYLGACAPAPRLWEAMRYAGQGGKLLRPVMVLAAVADSGGDLEGAVPLACAAEFVHAYSLVHDDLPPMDNDDQRRGRPSCHRQFDQATAILAGDALLALAFEVGLSARPARRARAAVQVLARAAGPFGICAGQSMDLGLEGTAQDPAAFEQCYYLKTGSLFAGSAVAGALLGTGVNAPVKALTGFGREFGLGFQLYDDIFDQAPGAPGTLLRWWSPQKAQERARAAMERARAHLPRGYVRLKELAYYVEGLMAKDQ